MTSGSLIGLDVKFDYGSHIDWKHDTDDVIIRHCHGAQIRASPAHHEIVDHKGGQGDWSKWNITLSKDDPTIIQVQSRKTKKYLRISKNGDKFEVNDGNCEFSQFKLHFVESVVEETEAKTSAKETADKPILATDQPCDDIDCIPFVQFESIAFPGVFVGVKAHEGVVIATSDSNNINMEVLKKGIKDKEGFSEPYMFQKENTVLIRHPHEGGIAIIDGKLSERGTKALNSRWIAIPSKEKDKEKDDAMLLLVRFKHEETGDYLEIGEDKLLKQNKTQTDYTLFKVHIITSPNVVKLESHKINGAFIAVREEGVVVGKGGPHSQMTILRR